LIIFIKKLDLINKHMSLAINTTTPEGIVLAADSRQSYRNQKGVSRIGSDSASKLFLINNRIGVAVTGLAFLQENGIPKNISKFIEQFKREVEVEKLSVKEIADKLHYLFDKKLNWQEQLDKLPDQIKDNFIKQGFEIIEVKKEQYNVKFKIKDKAGNIKDGVGGIDGLVLFAAGYNSDGSHEVYNVYIPGEIMKRRDSNQKGMEYGANWIGQTDVVSRIIKGWDPRILNTAFIGEIVKQKGQPEIEKQLNSLEYAINWGDNIGCWIFGDISLSETKSRRKKRYCQKSNNQPLNKLLKLFKNQILTNRLQ